MAHWTGSGIGTMSFELNPAMADEYPPQGQPGNAPHGHWTHAVSFGHFGGKVTLDGFLSGVADLEGHRLLHMAGLNLPNMDDYLPNLEGYQVLTFQNAQVELPGGSIKKGLLRIEQRVTAVGHRAEDPGIGYLFQVAVLGGDKDFKGVGGRGVGVGNLMLDMTSAPPTPLPWATFNHYWLRLEK